ncbi:MAG: twin-arginine translocation signal domain-containing protein [Planctomycetes bacterium]|nr:twin-arginine translocation signal domain-containing protein [Planctomycetota bacterium]
MRHDSRRNFLKTTGTAIAGAALGLTTGNVLSQETSSRQATDVEVLNPMGRTPLSFIIDDSTCLVNMGHFCTPQFAAAFPNRDTYKRPWQTWPREIPDAFLREFGEWCAAQGVKGKYSVVPNPACVGWLDRELPGWSRRELLDSLKLVRELMLPNWDIHPEMITHTRVIDIKTGRPFPGVGPANIENSYPREKKSVDELAAYIAYALRILKNCDLPCEGITTPGGFGNLVKSELSLAVGQAVRDVFSAEIPHYFKYVHTGSESTEPTLEHVSGVDAHDVRLTVNIPAGTGDWFGGWQGVTKSEGHRYTDAEAGKGRMVDLIEQGRPAIMLCHWPGMYCNGTKEGFEDFKRVVEALDGRFRDETIWMKLSEIARYWAAKELTQIRRDEAGLAIQAPFATPRFTLRVAARDDATPRIRSNEQRTALEKVSMAPKLKPGTWMRDGTHIVVCFDLPKGKSSMTL